MKHIHKGVNGRKKIEININKLEELLKKYCGTKYKYSIERAQTTCSVYAVIYGNYHRIGFRLSNHGKDSNIRQLRIDNQVNMEQVEGFIKRAIRRLDHLEIEGAFESIKKGK